jgi:hypothetical protein
MARLIFLDSGPLGLIVRAPSRPQGVGCAFSPRAPDVGRSSWVITN